MNWYTGQQRRSRIAAIKRLGGKCVRCGFSDWRALQFDHVKGDGGGRRRSGTKRFFDQISRGDKDIQLLCANCNIIKRVELLEGHSDCPDLNEFFLKSMEKERVNATQSQGQIVATLGGDPFLAGESRGSLVPGMAS